jgi:hypothetical protein
VYAPPDMADPEELKDYPEAGDAYKDNFGTIVEHNPDRPELPESLPRYGKPPEQPYHSVRVVLFPSLLSFLEKGKFLTLCFVHAVSSI